jgi:hypothetical protein
LCSYTWWSSANSVSFLTTALLSTDGGGLVMTSTDGGKTWALLTSVPIGSWWGSLLEMICLWQWVTMLPCIVQMAKSGLSEPLVCPPTFGMPSPTAMEYLLLYPLLRQNKSWPAPTA